MTLRTSFAILAGVVATGFAGLVSVWGESGIVPATLGLAITLPPTVATLAGVHLICLRWPEAGPLGVLGATFLRLIWAVGLVALLQPRANELGTTATALAQWTTAFYLITLAAETALLWRLLSRPQPTRGPDDAPTASDLRR